MSQIKKIAKEYFSFVSQPKAKAYSEYFLENAECFSADQLLSQYQTKIDVLPKSCFRNSVLAAVENRDLFYYEGFYLTKHVPLVLPHAFNVDKLTGRVIDLTAQFYEIPVLEYIAVRIPYNFILKSNFANDLLALYITEALNLDRVINI